MSKTDSQNIKELIARVLNALCKHADLRGLVVQQGGSKALIPLALEGTEKGMRQAGQALARIGITQDPAIAFPGQRVRNNLWITSLWWRGACKVLTNGSSFSVYWHRPSHLQPPQHRVWWPRKLWSSNGPWKPCFSQWVHKESNPERIRLRNSNRGLHVWRSCTYPKGGRPMLYQSLRFSHSGEEVWREER